MAPDPHSSTAAGDGDQESTSEKLAMRSRMPMEVKIVEPNRVPSSADLSPGKVWTKNHMSRRSAPRPSASASSSAASSPKTPQTPRTHLGGWAINEALFEQDPSSPCQRTNELFQLLRFPDFYQAFLKAKLHLKPSPEAHQELEVMVVHEKGMPVACGFPCEWPRGVATQIVSGKLGMASVLVRIHRPKVLSIQESSLVHLRHQAYKLNLVGPHPSQIRLNVSQVADQSQNKPALPVSRQLFHANNLPANANVENFPFESWVPSPGLGVETVDGMLGRVVSVLDTENVVVKFPGLSKISQVSPRQIRRRTPSAQFRTTLTPRGLSKDSCS
mmetsp:Transcript_31207/g.48908  ORF Transcript_31207/g.48908 Transcript_31207/m.48908 type:complete len:330 (-) Transcript_31207:74-1063(-)